MSFSNHGRLLQQVRFLQRQFLQDGELPFTDVLSEETVKQALKAVNVTWLDRVYSPVVTLWVFLGQVLSQDHSCRAAVARLIAHRVSRGQNACSAETGAYCQDNPQRRAQLVRVELRLLQVDVFTTDRAETCHRLLIQFEPVADQHHAALRPGSRQSA